MKTIRDIMVFGETVLLRVDYNVPVDAHGKVTDTARIAETKPTVDWLRQRGSKVVLLSHFGRPKGKVVEKLRFEPIVPTISKVLEGEVNYVPEAIGEKAVTTAVNHLDQGEVLLLENIRFYPGEEKNDPAFAQELAKLGDIYLNDAFGASHRAHASTVGVAALLPHGAGLLMEREVNALRKVLEQPAAPVVAIIGGAKISTKLDLIKNLLPKVDVLLLGGALANTILLAQGKKVGQSLVEADLAKTVTGLLTEKLFVPEDAVVAVNEKVTAAQARTVTINGIRPDEMILDIGPRTVKRYAEQIARAKTIIWNGPMGMFERKPFAEGTFALARAVADATTNGAYSVLGGGETVSAIHVVGLADKVSFISTGGGAMLEFMEGKQLPGIEALN